MCAMRQICIASPFTRTFSLQIFSNLQRNGETYIYQPVRSIIFRKRDSCCLIYVPHQRRVDK